MYTAGAQHSSSRLSLWRPAPQEKLLLCVNVAAPEKRSRLAHGWKGRPRSWQRSARWYQAFFFFFAGARRSLVPHTKTKTISLLKPRLFDTCTRHTGTRADFFFGMYQLETRFARITYVGAVVWRLAPGLTTYYLRVVLLAGCLWSRRDHSHVRGTKY